MSLFGTIGTLNSAMQAFTYGQAVTASNIANVNTPGYAAQSIDLASGTPTNVDNLSIGGGVTATGVSNTRNVYLDNQLRLELGQLGFQQARNSGLQQIAALFPEVASASATSGLQGAIADVATQWAALAALPSTASAATVAAAKGDVVSSLGKLTAMFNTDSQQLYALQRNLDTQVTSAIAQVNSLADQVVQLNKQIQLGTVNPVNGQPNVLVDQREQVAEQLAQLIGANAVVTPNGTMTVTFAGGTLADGTQAYHLKAIPSSVNQSFTGVGYMDYNTGATTDVSTMINSGTLGGLLTARDQDVMGARLALDKMAFGVITFSNQVNDTYVAADGTRNALLVGTKASDIGVNQNVVANKGYVGDTRDSNNPGDLATIQAAIQSLDMYQEVASNTATPIAPVTPVDPTQPMSTQGFGLTPSGLGGTLVISGGGVGASITWKASDTLNDVIAQINSQGKGAFYATFDQNALKPVLRIFSTKPLVVQDTGGNLGQALNLSSVMVSSAPINNGPVITGQNSMVVPPVVPPVLPAAALLNSATNTANIFTQLYTGQSTTGSVLVNGGTASWTTAQNILTVNNNIAMAGGVSVSFDKATQTDTLTLSGVALLASPTGLGPISISDVTGNLTKAFNLTGESNASSVLATEVASLTGAASTTQALATQAQNLVTNTNSLQSAQSAVDLNAQMAQALQYQRAYEASVRMQYVIDEMLNVLINQMGSTGSSSSTPI